MRPRPTASTPSLPASISPAAARLLTLGELYDLCYYQDGPDIPYLNALRQAIASVAPGRHLLDCGCGTGFPGLYLSETHRTLLVDRSLSMLAVCRRRHRQRKSPALGFLCCDWLHLGSLLAPIFDVAVCCGNSIPQALTRRRRRASLRSILRTIRPGGVLLLDFRETEPGVQGDEDPPELYSSAVGDSQIDIVVEESQKNGILHRTKKVSITDANHVISVAEYSTSYLLFSREEFLQDCQVLPVSSVHLLPRQGRWNLTLAILTHE